jgi:disulfide bond formation protein DsbB
MLFALWLQHYRHLDPCPLCIFQRVGLIGLGLFAFVGLWVPLQRVRTQLLVGWAALLSIVWSVGVAARHVWLQYLPADDVPACGPGLDYWLQILPFNEVVQQVLHGSGECAKVDWTLLGLSLPHWSLLYFLVLTALTVPLLFKRKTSIFSGR